MGGCECFSTKVTNSFTEEPAAKSWPVPKVDTSHINDLFRGVFSKSRSTCNEEPNKSAARLLIVNQFKKQGLMTWRQRFSIKPSDVNYPVQPQECNIQNGHYKGINIIGIRPGRFYKENGKDSILVIGAHYDSVRDAPGVDDNGSGTVALIELTRILSTMTQLNHTVIFVAFDLEEAGLVGSQAFVNEYLIPKELVDHDSKFLGAYIMDMLLDYRPQKNTQMFDDDMERVSNLVLKYFVTKAWH